MIVHIPTYKRMDRQPTATALANAGIGVVFVVRKEGKEYGGTVNGYRFSNTTAKGQKDKE